MRHSIKIINATLRRENTNLNKQPIHSALRLAQEYDDLIYHPLSKNPGVVESDQLSPVIKEPNSTGNIPLWEKRPYLTAGGWHTAPEKRPQTPEDIEMQIGSIRHYLDQHYLEWKKSN